MRSFGCASTAARLFVGTTILPRSTWSVHLLVLVGPAPPFYGPACSLHTVRMLALAFSIRGPFGASSAPIETQQPVLNECGSVLAHAFFLWLPVYAVKGLLAPPTWFPPHCPWYSSSCLKSFRRRRMCALRVDPLPRCRLVWSHGANWDSNVLQPPPSVMVPRDCQASSISSAPFDSVPIASSSVELACCAAAYAAAFRACQPD